ncbi:MAG: hypothetical protein K2Q06_07255, partial [Parvularculaceae bacterium]|nr:hypothetical protein [Parvularculaceae bacterium]
LPEAFRAYGLVIGLVAAIVVFLGWRALSFHNFDSIVHARLFGLTINRVVELTLLAFLLIAVAIPQSRTRHDSRHP